MRALRGLLWIVLALSLPALAFAQPKHPLRVEPTPDARPTWLPAPATAGILDRDVIAYEQQGFILVKIGPAAPERLDSGRFPAVSPRGDLLALSPDTRIGVKLVDLANPGLHTRFLPSFTRIAEIAFSPDGSKLACRSDSRIDIVDPMPGVSWPQTVTSSLTGTQSLQGFSPDGTALTVIGPAQVTWYKLTGQVLRQEPIPAPAAMPAQPDAATQCLPSPANAQLQLVARNGALFLFDIKTNSHFRLTPLTMDAAQAAWTPDGRRIYFAGKPASSADSASKIYRINADGTGLTEIDTGRAPSVGTRS